MTQSPLNSHFNRIAGQCQAHAHMRTLTQCLNIGHSDIQALWRSPLESAKVGKRGAVIVPARLRKQFGIEEGSFVTAEARAEGILIRPAIILPLEKYTPERKAEFLLSNAVSDADYRKARKAVRKLGVDPDSIPHRRPT